MSVIKAHGLRKEYGTLIAVNDVEFAIEPGQVVGLIGPNGAGKTTLLRMLATLLVPTRGTAEILGYDLSKDYMEIRKRIGFLPDFFNLYNDLTLEECLEFFAQSYNVPNNVIEEKINAVLKYVDLEDKRTSFIRNLSRGMVQRMGMATLLVREPEVFLLDEPASGLDPKARVELREILKRLSDEGKAIFISSHILTELSGFCSHIAIMNKGHIVEYGEVEAIRQRVAGRKKITIEVLDDCCQAVDTIKTIPEIEVMAVQEATIEVELSGGPEDMAAMNTLLVQNGIKVVSLYEEKMDIEDLFMEISGK